MFAEVSYAGVGFGLGLAVVQDAASARGLGFERWAGAAPAPGRLWSSAITAVFLTQLVPSDTHPIRTQLRKLVNQALVG